MSESRLQAIRARVAARPIFDTHGDPLWDDVLWDDVEWLLAQNTELTAERDKFRFAANDLEADNRDLAAQNTELRERIVVLEEEARDRMADAFTKRNGENSAGGGEPAPGRYGLSTRSISTDLTPSYLSYRVTELRDALAEHVENCYACAGVGIVRRIFKGGISDSETMPCSACLAARAVLDKWKD